MLDHVIRGGTVVDGTGSEPFTADVGVSGGRIVQVGRISERGRRETAASGCIVTPGWIDIHTHYDGQVSWDDELEPSSANGVTTIVMGNCGVGFAPVSPGASQALIDLMEGVEDIPGTALHEGIPWGAWETFPQYMDYLATRSYSVDVGAQIPHSTVRFYAMGQRGADNEAATDDDIARMSSIVGTAVQAGALGFTMSRTVIHHSANGDAVPGTFADENEVNALAMSVGRAGRGVIEIIPGGVAGPLEATGGNERARPTRHADGEHTTLSAELALMERLSVASDRPVTFTTVLRGGDLEELPRTLKFVREANGRGAQLRPQFSSRAAGIITGLTGYHLFMRRPTYMKLEHLPLPERLREMRKPEVKAAILSERSQAFGAQATPQDVTLGLLEPLLVCTFRMLEPIDYEPTEDASVAALARAQGRDPVEYMYDVLLEHDGLSFSSVLNFNFPTYSLDHCEGLFRSRDTVVGLGDAGAHVNFICDMSLPTFQLVHWVRDRSRGQRLPVELVVAKQTRNNALLYGLHDRGALRPGLRADLNVIDLQRLAMKVPVMRHDLPAGGSRVMQQASGYVATLVAGELTRMNDQDTGARPGRLVRGS
jgi:N-acyl-D-aspartate/D-glutamate deacylase